MQRNFKENFIGQDFWGYSNTLINITSPHCATHAWLPSQALEAEQRDPKNSVSKVMRAS